MKIISISDEYLHEFAESNREFMQKHGKTLLADAEAEVQRQAS